MTRHLCKRGVSSICRRSVPCCLRRYCQAMDGIVHNSQRCNLEISYWAKYKPVYSRALRIFWCNFLCQMSLNKRRKVVKKLIVWRTPRETHCAKSVQIRSYFLFIFSRICTRKNSVYGHILRTEFMKESIIAGFFGFHKTCHYVTEL